MELLEEAEELSELEEVKEEVPKKSSAKKKEKNFGELINTFRKLGYGTSESISKAYFEMYNSDSLDGKKSKKGEKKYATRKRKSSKDAQWIFRECKARDGSGKAAETSGCHSL